WFCRLSIEDKIPDHSVFSRARHERFRESEVFRRVFERVVATCMAVGLVGGEAFSIDVSLIKADVDQTKRMPGDEAVNTRFMVSCGGVPFEAQAPLVASIVARARKSGEELTGRFIREHVREWAMGGDD
ncbi:MAG TPA: transposase, partial [Methyloceanibacter sp.]|nr:transposase [Methyloceanibacter sp.]